MFTILKIVLILISVAVLFQDLNERKTYWFWFPLLALIYGILHINHVGLDLFLNTALINLGVIAFFLVVIAAYALLKLKTAPTQVFGLADALLFIALAFTFPTIAFTVFFVFSLTFSLLMHLIFKHKSEFKTVALAGYMSLFFALVYLASWTQVLESPYLI